MTKQHSYLACLQNSRNQKEPSLNGVWDHAIDALFKQSTFHPESKSLHKWAHCQTMNTMEQFYQWDKRQLAIGELSTSYLENPRDKHSLEYQKTNPTWNLLMLWNASIT